MTRLFGHPSAHEQDAEMYQKLGGLASATYGSQRSAWMPGIVRSDWKYPTGSCPTGTEVMTGPSIWPKAFRSKHHQVV
jgi:hypothetical protein